mmetsp:Transcript_120943/g.386342  ORF Transcript_120943/g.386342 Transcript_120943/m.386342 type:complete len:426 (+) Transcript_120943:475-1752(+)
MAGQSRRHDQHPRLQFGRSGALVLRLSEARGDDHAQRRAGRALPRGPCRGGAAGVTAGPGHLAALPGPDRRHAVVDTLREGAPPAGVRRLVHRRQASRRDGEHRAQGRAMLDAERVRPVPQGRSLLGLPRPRRGPGRAVVRERRHLRGLRVQVGRRQLHDARNPWLLDLRLLLVLQAPRPDDADILNEYVDDRDADFEDVDVDGDVDTDILNEDVDDRDADLKDVDVDGDVDTDEDILNEYVDDRDADLKDVDVDGDVDTDEDILNQDVDYRNTDADADVHQDDHGVYHGYFLQGVRESGVDTASRRRQPPGPDRLEGGRRQRCAPVPVSEPCSTRDGCSCRRLRHRFLAVAAARPRGRPHPHGRGPGALHRGLRRGRRRRRRSADAEPLRRRGSRRPLGAAARGGGLSEPARRVGAAGWTMRMG